MPDNNGWETYSTLVIQQLEILANGIDALRIELQDVKNQLTELKAREDRVQELKAWKEKIDDVVSPTQMKVTLKDIEELKMFKTKAVTVFAVVQFIMAGVLAFMGLS
tara:strand:+ start:785 stop:1105 length:321 start_codon:yes stop_codon:yes gene_type:complete